MRRVFSFVPVIGGRVREPFEGRGHAFEIGDWALMDLSGTNRGPRLRQAPERFVPDRFRTEDRRYAVSSPERLHPPQRAASGA